MQKPSFVPLEGKKDMDKGRAQEAEGGKWVDILLCRITPANEAGMSCEPTLAINGSLTFGLTWPT